MKQSAARGLFSHARWCDGLKDLIGLQLLRIINNSDMNGKQVTWYSLVWCKTVTQSHALQRGGSVKNPLSAAYTRQ